MLEVQYSTLQYSTKVLHVCPLYSYRMSEGGM